MVGDSLAILPDSLMSSFLALFCICFMKFLGFLFLKVKIVVVTHVVLILPYFDREFVMLTT